MNVVKLPKGLYSLDNSSGIFACAKDYSLIAIAILFAETWSILYPAAVLLIGARQRGLADLLHQSSHLTLAKNRTLNRILGTWFSGYLVFQTLGAYRDSHITYHHGKFGTPADPDYAFHLELGLYGSFSYKNLAHGLLLYFRYLVSGRLGASMQHSKELICIVILWLCVLYAAGLEYFIWYWLCPMIFGYCPIGYFVELAEHWPLVGSQGKLYQTRNRASSRLEAWMFSAHNENFHLIHHLYPALPMTSYKAANKYLLSEWPEYRNWSKRNGGIFFSANDAPSVFQLVMHKVRNRPLTHPN